MFAYDTVNYTSCFTPDREPKHEKKNNYASKSCAIYVGFSSSSSTLMFLKSNQFIITNLNNGHQMIFIPHILHGDFSYVKRLERLRVLLDFLII